MKISARNQFAGKVVTVQNGAVNSVVTIDVNGTAVTATISNAAVEELALKEGSAAIAVIKATEVLLAKGDIQISARNKFAGKVAAVEKGAVNSVVTLTTSIGDVTATISNAAVEELGLASGVEAVAVVKATSVMVGC